MTEHATKPVEHHPDRPAKGLPTPKPAEHRPARSMHEDVPVWYDCCSCQAEPYWLEAAGEPGDPPGADGEGDCA